MAVIKALFTRVNLTHNSVLFPINITMGWFDNRSQRVIYWRTQGR
jgi:hypothetical protein